MQAEVGGDLLKHKDANSNLKKQLDMVADERDRLVGQLQEVQEAKVATKEKALEWVVTYDTQVKYINHLVFILGPLMDKLPEALATQITDLPREVEVEVAPTDRHALKMATGVTTLIVDTSIHANNDALTSVELDGAVNQEDNLSTFIIRSQLT